ncbi:type II secretion system F family protein [Adlercreutzia sp. R21]|uniref:Type II secretion system F family protein n=1 Tax=Adlercreutzia wanghongyangiae TaxID=3111451 RepID=A0ABU6IK01_9ACTN|nr:type II secretion system F family protein [Adlercreutzia sp. R21]MEC4176747.1 type II secretion system F family protein [Adlercreutzia sp. R7]MEC4184671.1 type II secretion system F family protein [Adlercreutzia sp. R21]
MGAIVGYTVVGLASAAAAGVLAGSALADRRERRLRMRACLDAEEASGSWVRWRLSRGVAPLRPAACALLRLSAVKRYAENLRMAALRWQPDASRESVLSCALAAVLGVAVAGWAVSASPVFGCAAAACLLVGLAGYGNAEAQRRAQTMRDEIPDALRSLGVCFRAGLSLVQTLRQTGSEMKGPIGEVFLASARVLETGGTATEALALFRRRSSVPELAFVAVALDVQHASGGSLASVLDAARESVEGEIELAQTLKVQTAQAQLSARIVTLMPFVLIALFSLMSPGFLTPFLASFTGVALLAAALAMQAAGVLLVHRMLDVGVG